MDQRQSQIREVLRRYGRRRFEYGVLDCCILVNELAKLRRGIDYRPLFPEYADAGEADLILAQFGGVEGVATHCLGDAIALVELVIADVALVKLPILEPLLGIYDGVQAFVLGVNGVMKVPRSRILKGWRL